jgi:hypothetical protein
LEVSANLPTAVKKFTRKGGNVSDDAQLLGDDPRGLFGSSSKMFSVPYPEIRELQLQALRYRFDYLKPRVQLLSRLAERNGVSDIVDLETGGRLLYPSNVYKSYPFDWLSEGRYEKLTKWLQQLTAHDLSKVDLQDVETLDEWFSRIEASTDLRLCHSSSTTGKLSFVPRGVDEWVRRTATMPFAYEAAGFDDGPEYFSYEGLPLISTFYRGGHSAALAGIEWQIKAFHDPDGTHPERLLFLYPGTLSSEIMVLAGRLRSGQVDGDPRSMQLPKRLLDRRIELTGLLEGTKGERLETFVREVAERFNGQRCIVSGLWPSMVDAAETALRLGYRQIFDPTSIVAFGGGEKGRTLPPNAREMVTEWTGVSHFQESYGMSELMGINQKCSRGKFHMSPWLVPYVLDTESLDPLPSVGRVTGRLGGIDLMASSFWSGYISTDRVTMNWDPPCECGRQGPYIEPEIGRVDNVEDDKISCAATPGALDETIEFLRARGA